MGSKIYLDNVAGFARLVWDRGHGPKDTKDSSCSINSFAIFCGSGTEEQNRRTLINANGWPQWFVAFDTGTFALVDR